MINLVQHTWLIIDYLKIVGMGVFHHPPAIWSIFEWTISMYYSSRRSIYIKWRASFQAFYNLFFFLYDFLMCEDTFPINVENDFLRHLTPVKFCTCTLSSSINESSGINWLKLNVVRENLPSIQFTFPYLKFVSECKNL